MHTTSTIFGAGVQVIVGVLLLRHYFFLITKAVPKCKCKRDFCRKLWKMDDARLLGVLVGLMLFVAYVYDIIGRLHSAVQQLSLGWP